MAAKSTKRRPNNPCATCKQKPRRPRQSTCTACHNAYSRAWNKKRKMLFRRFRTLAKKKSEA